MKKIKRFTDPWVLNAISVKHLAAFFDLFKHQIEPRYLPPAHYMGGTGGYIDTWVATLRLPHVVPRAMIEAIVAIEELASPENRALLDAKVSEARGANPYLDPADSPECRALQLWLLSPYKMTEAEPSAGAEKATPEITYC